MRYIPISSQQREAMLRAVGVSGIDGLFGDVPDTARIDGLLDLPAPLSEMELDDHLRSLAARNVPATSIVSLAGGGAYDHYIPSIVGHVTLRPEFFTAYTPYQPEVSQGTLQAIYEYQTMVCELTGMEVSNAGMYDGATAMVEAAFMAARITKRRKIVVSGAVAPQWRETLDTYATAGLIEPVYLPVSDGATPLAAAQAAVADAAALVVASPNYLGTIESVSAFAELAHTAGALLVVATNPVLLGVMEAPGLQGADIVVAEAQSLGNPMSLGGPGLGLFACREKNIRQMPGRLAGRTLDADGADAFVLTFSTREQHIRRERATSNICSNQALCALAAGVHLAAVGRDGLRAVAQACISKAHYLRGALISTGRFSAPWDAPFGHEFTLRYDGSVSTMREAMFERGYLAGLPVPADDSLVVFAVTERRTRRQLDEFVKEVIAL